MKPDGIYGPATAAAVKAYKEQRRILGPGQIVPDNIVGKLTIQSLDDEMSIFEEESTGASELVEITGDGHNHDHSNCPTAPSIQNTRVQHRGTPINPQGSIRINIGGEGETKYLGFRDFVTDTKNLFGPPRPLTNTIPSHTVTDLCMRSTIITTEGLDDGHGEREISRIARPGCRFTFANNPQFFAGGTDRFVLSLGRLIEDITVFDDTDPTSDGLRVFVIIMRGDGVFTPRVRKVR
ncbi:peptidoglycan-binding domain-containing protein [Lichenifustis flavocetrariae]|uniref:Peptidoglycan-binding protein n=1 Tax=Lichenifustis flavocetrariae TaxID=2949735 RepID=A0AA41ZC21_9HYPH|nr:peptidoglycan-binding domain-containing protein [Lichenifustis flavocetrariae]MCW6513122.1 peptidoglycan-binding protein [Lichenifustis flavocetrariae]